MPASQPVPVLQELVDLLGPRGQGGHEGDSPANEKKPVFDSENLPSVPGPPTLALLCSKTLNIHLLKPRLLFGL